MRISWIAAAAAVTLASPAAAAVVYSNNFNAENGGNSALNYNGFNGLTVTNGTVDLVKSGDFGITCAGGSGSCVDLDGSTSDSGLTSSNSFAFNAGDRIALSFLFSGNQRGGADDAFSVRFIFGGNVTGTRGFNSSCCGNGSFGNFSASSVGVNIFSISPNSAFSNFEFYAIANNAGTVNFTFEDTGNDNVGIIIDDVSLSIGAVPEPSAWALMIIGFGVVGAAARRRIGAKTRLA